MKKPIIFFSLQGKQHIPFSALVKLYKLPILQNSQTYFLSPEYIYLLFANFTLVSFLLRLNQMLYDPCLSYQKIFCLNAFRQAGPPRRVDCLAPKKIALSVFPKDTATRYHIGSRTKASEPFDTFLCLHSRRIIQSAHSAFGMSQPTPY